MKEPQWILDELVLSLHQILLAEHGGDSGIRDRSLLESALYRPKQRFQYESNTSLFQLASSYSFGLAKNHPFIDGNKRIALAVGGTFLEINGYSLNASEPEAVIMFEKLASGSVEEDELSAWFKKHSLKGDS